MCALEAVIKCCRVVASLYGERTSSLIVGHGGRPMKKCPAKPPNSPTGALTLDPVAGPMSEPCPVSASDPRHPPWTIAAEKICKQMTLFLSYNIQFMYEYYAIGNKSIAYAFNAVTSSLPSFQFLADFFERMVSSQSLQLDLFRNTLIYFLLHNL